MRKLRNWEIPFAANIIPFIVIVYLISAIKASSPNISDYYAALDVLKSIAIGITLEFTILHYLSEMGTCPGSIYRSQEV